MNRVVGTHDLLWVTLDTLRYDVAQACHGAGRTPNLSRRLTLGGWERRHTPGSFSFAAHAAFFAGFLPTPATPGPHPRPFAARFPGSETTSPETFVFDAPDIANGLRTVGYHTICVGGVGFFNKLSPLGNVFPSLFDESHWSPDLGVTALDSTANQVRLAVERLAAVPPETRVFLFVNVSALHQPNCGYVAGATTDTAETQAAALEYVDAALPPLFDALAARGRYRAFVFSDHGTAYGEGGYTGHRLAHPTVWDVPYAEFGATPEG